MEFDLTKMIDELDDLHIKQTDQFVMSFVLENIFWGSISSCQLLGGLSQNLLNSPTTCTVDNATQFYVTNFQGFIENDMYPTGQRKRIRVLFTTGSLTDNTLWLDKTVTIGLFANIDAYTNSLQAISRKTVQLKNNCNSNPAPPCTLV